MKLIDFSKASYFKSLFKDMGITSILPITPIRVNPNSSRYAHAVLDEENYKDFQNDIKTSSVDLDSVNFLQSIEGLLEANGIRCCVYIYDQNFEGYKYHLCNCRTIKEMKARGQASRYVATARDDGLFLVNLNGSRQLKRLELCQNCKDELRALNINPNIKLKDFFKTHGAEVSKPYEFDFIKGAIKRNSNCKIDDDYMTKQAADWSCQECGLYCYDHKDLLIATGRYADDGYRESIVRCADCDVNAEKNNQPAIVKKYLLLVKRCQKLKIDQGIAY